MQKKNTTRLYKKLKKPKTTYELDFFNLRRGGLEVEYSWADYICLSYPKCGRTWVRYVLGNYLHLKYGVENTHVLNSLKKKTKRRRKKNCPLISFTHDNHSFVNEKNIENNKISLDKFMFEGIYKEKKLILLMRDPIDASVSYYKMAKNITKIFTGGYDDWFKDETFGLNGLIKWYQAAYDLYQNHPNKIVLHYEKLKTDTSSWIKLVNFITDEEVNEEWLQQSLSIMNFDIQKKDEMIKKNITDPDSDSLFFRQAGTNYQKNLPQQIQDKIQKNKQLQRIRKCVESME